MGYRKCSDWKLKTMGGASLSVGIEKMGLSVSGGARTVQMQATRYGGGKVHELSLEMTLTGMQFSIEKGVDLVQSLTGAQVAVFRQEKDSTQVQVNQKKEIELMTSDFLGPCALISYDLGKASVIQELKKLGGATILYIGMGAVIVDQGPDWLERVVDNATSSTLGGNVAKFNANNMPWCNARAASRIELNDRSLGAKIETSIAMFSGQIKATGMRSY